MAETAVQRPAMRRRAAPDMAGPPALEAPPAVDVAGFVSEARTEILARLDAAGAVLLRGLEIVEASAVRDLIEALGSTPIGYDERTTPRRAVGEAVYTSTEHPARCRILPHNENAYAASWPALLAFACVRPAARGGETPLYDGRRVLAALDPALVAELSRREVMHVRNFGTGLGLSVAEAFGTESREVVERRLTQSGVAWEWRADGGLRMRWRTGPVLVHPRTGERVFFNHVAFFHQSALPKVVRADMLDLYGPEGLPHATFFGDGASIPDATIAAILNAYGRCELRFPWRRGDCLLVDNMLCAHGRLPFEGERLVLVALADPVHRRESLFV